jgi:large subunit ribosomal protein L31e
MGDGQNRRQGAQPRKAPQLAQAAHQTVGEKMPEERIYVIPLRAATQKAKRKKRTPRAVKTVREFLKRHMKSENVKIGEDLNRKLWERGIERTLPRIRVKAVKQDDGSVEASLAE